MLLCGIPRSEPVTATLSQWPLTGQCLSEVRALPAPSKVRAQMSVLVPLPLPRERLRFGISVLIVLG